MLKGHSLLLPRDRQPNKLAHLRKKTEKRDDAIKSMLTMYRHLLKSRSGDTGCAYKPPEVLEGFICVQVNASKTLGVGLSTTNAFLSQIGIEEFIEWCSGIKQTRF